MPVVKNAGWLRFVSNSVMVLQSLILFSYASAIPEPILTKLNHAQI